MSHRSLGRLPKLKVENIKWQLSCKVFFVQISTNLLEDLWFQSSLQPLEEKTFLIFKIGSLEDHPAGAGGELMSFTTSIASDKKHRFLQSFDLLLPAQLHKQNWLKTNFVKVIIMSPSSSRTTKARAAMFSITIASQFIFHHPIARGDHSSTFFFSSKTIG